VVAGGVRLRLLERPAWGVAEDGGAGEGDGAIPLGNEEAAGGVGMGAGGGGWFRLREGLQPVPCGSGAPSKE